MLKQINFSSLHDPIYVRLNPKDLCGTTYSNLRGARRFTATAYRGSGRPRFSISGGGFLLEEANEDE